MKKILHFQAAETAKQRGAAVIVITGHIQSLLAKIVDICLHGMGGKLTIRLKPERPAWFIWP